MRERERKKPGSVTEGRALSATGEGGGGSLDGGRGRRRRKRKRRRRRRRRRRRWRRRRRSDKRRRGSFFAVDIVQVGLNGAARTERIQPKIQHRRHTHTHTRLASPDWSLGTVKVKRRRGVSFEARGHPVEERTHTWKKKKNNETKHGNSHEEIKKESNS